MMRQREWNATDSFNGDGSYICVLQEEDDRWTERLRGEHQKKKIVGNGEGRLKCRKGQGLMCGK